MEKDRYSYHQKDTGIVEQEFNPELWGEVRKVFKAVFSFDSDDPIEIGSDMLYKHLVFEGLQRDRRLVFLVVPYTGGGENRYTVLFDLEERMTMGEERVALSMVSAQAKIESGDVVDRRIDVESVAEDDQRTISSYNNYYSERAGGNLMQSGHSRVRFVLEEEVLAKKKFRREKVGCLSHEQLAGEIDVAQIAREMVEKAFTWIQEGGDILEVIPQGLLKAETA